MFVFLGLTFGNFAYQFIFSEEPNYIEAAQITFFQAYAIFVYYIFQ